MSQGAAQALGTSPQGQIQFHRGLAFSCQTLSLWLPTLPPPTLKSVPVPTPAPPQVSCREAACTGDVSPCFHKAGCSTGPACCPATSAQPFPEEGGEVTKPLWPRALEHAPVALQATRPQKPGATCHLPRRPLPVTGGIGVPRNPGRGKVSRRQPAPRSNPEMGSA